MFGDIPKVTPSSKVVGDMALAMVSAGLERADIEDADKEFAFPPPSSLSSKVDLGNLQAVFQSFTKESAAR